MSRIPDLVIDSRLQTEFHGSVTTHSYLEIDEAGRRFSREESWKEERFLGRGGFGQVRLERHLAQDTKQGSLRAVKIINKPSDSFESLDLNRELEAIAKFSNNRYRRWFVKSFGWYDDATSVFISMEYCQYGDLHHYLKRTTVLPNREVQQLIYQILEGLDQMHQNDFAHRDLKPGNILIKAMPPEERWWIVLADFGISKRADESNGPTTVNKGTAEFMAPELLGYLDHLKPKSISGFKAADMWALGEITFQMLTGEATFQRPMELINYCSGQLKFPSGRLPTSATDDGHKFVTSIMTALPQHRITTTQCIQHRWMEINRVEEEFSQLNLTQSRLLMPEMPWSEPASAQWSRLSSNDDRTTQMTVERSSISVQHGLPAGRESLVLAEMKLVQTLNGHTHAIHTVAFSPDGKRLVSISPTSIAQLWDGKTGRLVQALKFDPNWVWLGVFSPDNKLLAIAVNDGTIRLFNGRTGELVQTIRASPDMVLSVTFSPDSKRLVSTSNTWRPQLWNSESGELVQRLEGGGNRGNQVAFSPDGRQILVLPSIDNLVRIWDGESGKLIQTLRGHSGLVYFANFSPDGKRLVSASYDKTVLLWDSVSGKLIQMLEGHSGSVYQVAFSPDSRRLVSASASTIVQLCDGKSGKLIQMLEGHSGSVYQVAFSPDSRRLVSASADTTVRLWDGESGKLIQTLEGHSDDRKYVIFSPDGKRLASISTSSSVVDMIVRLWDGKSGKLIQTLEGHSGRVNQVAFSPDSRRLASASEDMTVRLWGAESCSPHPPASY